MEEFKQEIWSSESLLLTPTQIISDVLSGYIILYFVKKVF